MARIISGKYEVLSQVGKGGMGAVYKVRHLTLETTLALKVLPGELAEDGDLVRRFHQEARVMAQLRHPHIVQVLDVDRDGDTHFFVMEYVEGMNLSQYLRDQGALSLLEVLTISRQVAQALEYAHTHQPPIIHRDIKPANILIEAYSRRVMVTDFGIAKVLGATEQTRTGLVMGTLRYCAPEQMQQDRELDGRADIYSLGLVMYEMATGRPFFAETDERALLGRVLHGPGDNVPTFAEPVPPAFRALVTLAIAREREHRYQRAAELLHGIEACLATHSDTASTVLLGESFSNGEEKAQQKQKVAPLPQEKRPWWSWRPPLPLVPEKKKRWWSWRPRLPLWVSVALSAALVVICSAVYWQPQPNIPSLSGLPSFAQGEYEKAFENLKTGQIDAAQSIFQWITTALAMIMTQKSEELTTGTGEKVLLVPFPPGGGNLRRLGEEEALVWQLARQLPPSMQHEIAGQDALRRGQRGGLIPDPATLITLAREKGAAYIIWGELQSFVTKLIIHGQVAEVKTGTVKRVRSVQEGINGRLEAAARAFAQQVADAAAQKQSERKP